jgi:hypothetical protein
VAALHLEGFIRRFFAFYPNPNHTQFTCLGGAWLGVCVCGDHLELC